MIHVGVERRNRPLGRRDFWKSFAVRPIDYRQAAFFINALVAEAT
jgi:hypothetical protein